ncbi:MAG: pyridoxine 4-dehydrogenase [Mycobacterium sp.]|jgi:aryl-alcohol dehydrogenase-like predicted oxidoreductase|nr:pyridoxine 4-dehydrogenase [Mycobacterium sp.]
MSNPTAVQASGTITIGGDLTVHRLGLGTMRLTGEGFWGPPRDRDECIRLLRRAVELGIDFIDTADSYGPFVTEELIKEALHPYGGVVIATKAGFLRPHPNAWHEMGYPAYLRQAVEMSLRRLDVERIELLQLHRIDWKFPLADQVGELADMQAEGKIRHIGLSEISIKQLQAAQEIAPIVSVQNRYSMIERKSDPLLETCQSQGIAFIPWAPLGFGQLATAQGTVERISKKYDTSPSQLAVAWLLKRSPVMVPIPGTSRVAHLEENVKAAQVQLSDADFEAVM